MKMKSMLFLIRILTKKEGYGLLLIASMCGSVALYSADMLSAWTMTDSPRDCCIGARNWMGAKGDEEGY
jgi:hypothetical protein